jgi:hypothetical protein
LFCGGSAGSAARRARTQRDRRSGRVQVFWDWCGRAGFLRRAGPKGPGTDNIASLAARLRGFWPGCWTMDERSCPLRAPRILSQPKPLSHSHDSEFTGVHRVHPPRRQRSLSARLFASTSVIHSTHVPPFFSHDNDAVSFETQSISLLGPRWREPAHTLFFRSPRLRVQPPLHVRSPCPMSYLGRKISSDVNRKGTSIALMRMPGLVRD